MLWIFTTMKNDHLGTIGIIGGMGPAATALLFERIIKYTDASCDADHIHILIDNNPFIPDRTKSILEGNDRPVLPIVESGRMLERMGATVLIFPCNTAHFYLGKIQSQLSIPVINMVEETAKICFERGYKKVAILGTDGTLQAKTYETVMNKYYIDVIYPAPSEQKRVMHIIYDQVKAGKNADIESLESCFCKLEMAGAEAFVLACTELSVAFQNCKMPYIFIDSMDALAKEAIRECGYKVRKACL